MSGLVLIITIGGTRAAIAAPAVDSVMELDNVYPVPRTPRHVAGLAAIRSQTMTVIDCKAALGLHPASLHSGRCPVVAVDGHMYALLVDAVEDVVETISDVRDIPGGYGAAWTAVALGMIETASGPVLLIDPAKLVVNPAAEAA
ncbi:chemotaxis protein CheW [Pontixanthobacter sp.]|uniref:chemotaxis protein CheW n=1 Tax=Pontixanthobacter sp. TaxID=2792078 RepID=UPI003C7AD2DC